MNVLSLFSGGGLGDYGLELAGMETVGQCEKCGAMEKLHAHHIDGKLPNNSSSNIQTLCASCHITHHHRARRAGLMVAGRLE